MKTLIKREVPDLESALARLERNGVEVLGARFLICMIVSKETTTGGIIIPDSVKGHEELAQQFGTVVQVGESVCATEKGLEYFNSEKVEVGQKFMFAKFAGQGRSFILEGEGDDADFKYVVCNDINSLVRLKNLDGVKLP